MIHIHWENPEELRTWYAEEMLSRVRNSGDIPQISLSPFSSPALERLPEKLNRMANTNGGAGIRDILLLPRPELEEKHPHLRLYLHLCDFYMGVMEPEAFAELPDVRQSDLPKERKELKTCLDKVNAALETRFNYDKFLTREIRGELVERMGVPICPYCNRQFIHSYADCAGRRYLGNLDHALPKSIYRLLSLSLWNLVPCCFPCNVRKGNQAKPILNPYKQGFDANCVLTPQYEDAQAVAGLNNHFTLSWKIAPEIDPDTRQRIQNEIDIFALNAETGSYAFHKREIRIALKRRYLYASEGYRKSLSVMVGLAAFPDEQSIYGVSMKPEKFQEEILSKALFDVLKDWKS